MKVLIVCMAFAAVAFAMPVAEEKPIAPVPAESISVPKVDDVQPQVKADAVVVEEKKPEQAVENKESVKPQEPELKSVPIESLLEDTKQVEPAVAVSSSDVKNEVPEGKSIGPVNVEPETRPVEIKSVAVSEPEDNKENSEVKSVVVEEVKQESEAKVKEVVEEASVPSPKSVLPEESIDVVSAIKTPAALADDFVDIAGLSPPEKTELPIAATKIAEPVSDDKEKDIPAPALKTTLPEVEKPVESKPADKVVAVEAPASVPVLKEAPTEPKSAVDSVVPVDDPLRVVRDTVDDKKAVEVPVVEAKDAPATEIEAPKESEADKKLDSKDLKAIDPVVLSESAKDTPAAQSPIEAPKPSEGESKAIKDEEKPAGDAPADSSEESAESSENKGNSGEKDSSEEVTDKKESKVSKS